MNLDYGSLLSPEPIMLSIGSLRNPTLRAISRLTFNRFNVFQAFLKMTPENFYTKINAFRGGIEKWEGFSDEEKSNMTMYDIVKIDSEVRETYLDIFNFFFIEKVVYQEGMFFVLSVDKNLADADIKISPEIIRGVIHEEIFPQALEIIQELCCIKEEDTLDGSNMKFKNKKAHKLWERMQAAQKENAKKQAEKNNINLTIPNIISAVAAKSNNLNIITIWDITLFQLYDQFNRVQNNDAHSINSIRVATWGDEKKTFDYTLWYKNTFDKQHL